MSTYRVAYGPMERERAVASRAEALLARRRPYLRSLASRRNARLGAGCVGVAGATATAASLVVERATQTAPLLLAGSVAASFAVYALLRLFPSWLPRRWPAIARSFERVEALSVGVPLVAASLLGPLAIHALVYGLLVGVGPSTHLSEVLDGFAKWMVLSGAIVGHAHVALAILSAMHAKKLAETPTIDLASDPIRKRWVGAFWITVGVSAVPGVLLIGIPPLLTIVTGLFLIPAMFGIARTTIVREREALDEAEDAITGVRVGIEELEAARDELYDAELSASRSSA